MKDSHQVKENIRRPSKETSIKFALQSIPNFPKSPLGSLGLLVLKILFFLSINGAETSHKVNMLWQNNSGFKK